MRLLWIAAGVIAVDQATKVVVRQTMAMPPYRSIALIGDWFKLTYTENPGMAFGITFGPRGMVTALSIIATLLIIVYLYRIRKGYRPYRASLCLILGGAIGNIIDRIFYARIFGYGSLFEGRVVDFIHVNLWSGYIPESVPLLGGDYISLFPIWNVADMAIVIGVVGILFFQKQFHQQLEEQAMGVQSPPEPSVNGAVSQENVPEPPSVLVPPPVREDKPPEIGKPE